MNRGAEHEIAHLLREIERLVEETDPEPGRDRQGAVAATLEIDARRWRLAAIVSGDPAYNERAAA